MEAANTSFEKSFRLPEPNELFGDGGVLLQGNNSLRPETSYNYNFGAGYFFRIRKNHQVNLNGNGFFDLSIPIALLTLTPAHFGI